MIVRQLQLKNKAFEPSDRQSAPQKIRMSDGHLLRFIKDDRGEHAMEFLMILTYGILPIIGAVYLLEDIFREYVAYGQIFVTSPFF